MAKPKSEIGNKYGMLTVIEESPERIRSRVCWKCKCDCGNEIIVIGTDLRTGRKTHCGCQSLNLKDETGNKYGLLTVVERVKETTNSRHAKWKCQCECGNTTIVSGQDLRQGKTKSCGCLEQESRGQSVLINEIGNKYGKLTVIDKIRPDNKTTYWKCQCECGNIIYVVGSSLRNGHTTSCGCVHSKGNETIQKILSSLNINYKTEISFKDLISLKNGHPRFDFGVYDNNNNLIFLLEYQGIQHFINKGNFGKTQREETDILKKVYCKDKNIKLYEITYEEEIENKLKSILNKENLL